MFYFFMGVLSFLSVVGAVELFRKFNFWLYKPMRTKFCISAVIRHIDDAENTVRTIIERIRWMELDTEVEIIIIDETKNQEVAEIIAKIIKKYPNISLLY